MVSQTVHSSPCLVRRLFLIGLWFIGRGCRGARDPCRNGVKASGNQIGAERDCP
jgi:hypothetical protein